MKKYLLVFTLLFLSACQNMVAVIEKGIKQPEVSYKSFGVGDISERGIELLPKFEVKNENPFSVPLEAVSYTLSFNNKTMLDGTINDIGKLPAKDSKYVTLSLMLNDEVLSSFKQLLLKNDKLDYAIRGEAKFLAFSVPFEKKGIFYRPRISFGELKVGKASFDEMQLTITMNIDNPNDFALPLENFKYSLTSKGKALFEGGIAITDLKQGMNSVQIPVTIKPEQVFSNMLSLMSNPELPMEFKLNGPMQNVTKTFSLNLKQFISL